MKAKDSFLMCPPRFFAVEYVINPWMEGNVGRARSDVALRQWDGLRSALSGRADIELIEPAAGLPDMTFTANAGLVAERTFVPARFRFFQREPEVARFTRWFEERGYEVAPLPGLGTFEGEGDALFQPGEPLLWGGYGVRTSLQAYRDLGRILDLEIVPLRLVDERFYHLDTCFCPLPGGRVMYYPDAFDRDSLAAVESRIPAPRRLAVPPTDALSFACNAVVVGSTVITNFAGDTLRAQLAAWGFEVIVCPLAEFLLAGGAAKCLVLRLAHARVERRDRRAAGMPPSLDSSLRESTVDLHGHLLDNGLMNRALDAITEAGGSFEIEGFQPGLRHDQPSSARLRIVAPSTDRLDAILLRLMDFGARVVSAETDARLEPVTQPGVAPADFYSTTIFPTEVRIEGRWHRAGGQRMDAVLVVSGPGAEPRVRCRLIRDLVPGERVVCGLDGVRIHVSHGARRHGAFAFMTAGVSSERRVELAVERVAWEMRRIRQRDGKIVVVAGPVLIHTGGGRHLASLIRRGYVQALLGGNGLAAHDIEEALFGTSLGVDLRRGVPVAGGHQHHLRAINLVRSCGSIAGAVERGAIQSGVFYECVTRRVPFALAGSIRDDGPLPDTMMDLIQAQAACARLIEGADMILMLASMLHAIGVGNMTPAGVRLICVDISPAVVTKLADRGSVESTGIVTDVGLFLNLLDARLGAEA